MRAPYILLPGLGTVMAFAAVWHGPLGAGERLAGRAEIVARRTLDYYDLPMIQAGMARGPLSRRLILSGPADDFQRSELVRILDDIPGVVSVSWDPASLPQERKVGP